MPPERQRPGGITALAAGKLLLKHGLSPLFALPLFTQRKTQRIHIIYAPPASR